jgi:hypothetical protein
MVDESIYESILLLDHEKTLLREMVENFLNSTKEAQSRGFALIRLSSGSSILVAPDGNNKKVTFSDFEDLDQNGLIRLRITGDRSGSFSITPKGFSYYQYLHQGDANKVDHIEDKILRYMNSEAFRSKYGAAWAKWSKAYDLMLQPNPEQYLSQIGHLCRESVQEFTDVLFVKFKLDAMKIEKAKTVSRLKLIFAECNKQESGTRMQLLNALLEYWGALQDFIQRQEHSGQKESQQVTVEESRCLVFQTMNVMYEIGRVIA